MAKRSVETEVVNEHGPQAIATRSEAVPAVQQVVGSATFMERLIEMASNPAINVETIDKLLDANDRVMAIAERKLAEQAKREFNTAYTQMQAQAGVVRRGGVGQSGRFARLTDIMAVYQPLLDEFGFSLRSYSEDVEGGRIRTVTVLAHSGGHSEQDSFTSRPDTGGNKNDIQAGGSARAYHRRYNTKSLLNVIDATDDELDERSEEKTSRAKTRDAEPAPVQREAGKPDERPITKGTKEKPGQRERLFAILKKSGRDVEVFRAWLFGTYGYSSTADIKRSDYDAIVEAIQSEGELPGTIDREPGEEG